MKKITEPDTEAEHMYSRTREGIWHNKQEELNKVKVSVIDYQKDKALERTKKNIEKFGKEYYA